MAWSYRQCEYYNHGLLDKVDQSDYRKITIHSKKVSCQSSLLRNEINNMDQHQLITTYRCDRLNPLKKARVSWEVHNLELMTVAKNINISYILDLNLHVIAKRSNIVARKLLVDEKITVCVKQICLQCVVCKGKRIKTVVWWNILPSWKTFAINI